VDLDSTPHYANLKILIYILYTHEIQFVNDALIDSWYFGLVSKFAAYSGSEIP
jgi:hypothetical protein